VRKQGLGLRFRTNIEVTAAGWVIFDIEDLHYLYYLTKRHLLRIFKSKTVRGDDHTECVVNMTNIYNALAGEYEGNTLLGTLRRENHIEMGLEAVECRPN
jgi:hypothetical protein